MFKAKRFSVCSGTGVSRISPMNAFDNALYDAGIGDLNLISVSSVLPAGIVEVYDFTKKVGAFHPCVIAKSEGFRERMMAGLCFGFRKDGDGGYVAEYAVNDYDMTSQDFEKELHDRLEEMGEKRNIELIDVDCKIAELELNEEAYGCAVVVLVYLP